MSREDFRIRTVYAQRDWEFFGELRTAWTLIWSREFTWNLQTITAPADY
ncbi:hypothetical protein AVEN_201165-1, partial [Araneus ventricosus]